MFYSKTFIFYYTLFNIYHLNLTIKPYQISYPSYQKSYPTVTIVIIPTLLSDYHFPPKIKTYSNFPSPKIKTYDNFPKTKIRTYSRFSNTKNKDFQATNGSVIFPFTPAARVVQAMPAFVQHLPTQPNIPIFPSPSRLPPS